MFTWKPMQHFLTTQAFGNIVQRSVDKIQRKMRPEKLVSIFETLAIGNYTFVWFCIMKSDTILSL